jgi:hypothetical protein
MDERQTPAPRSITREQYTRIDAVNFSSLKYMLRSPEHYLAATQEPEPDDPARFAVGNLCHAMVLENKDLTDLYAIKEKGMRFSTKEGKAWKAAQNKPIITQEEAEGVPRMAQRVINDEQTRDLIAGCHHREQCVEFSFQGVEFKCLLDMWGEAESQEAVLGDYKTLVDCRQDAFSKVVDLRDYDMQMALYKQALLACGYADVYAFWIAQEKRRPYTAQTYKVPEEWMKRGLEKLQYCIALLKQCKKTGVWPGYGKGIQLLKQPSWLKPIEWGQHIEEAA